MNIPVKFSTLPAVRRFVDDVIRDPRGLQQVIDISKTKLDLLMSQLQERKEYKNIIKIIKG